MYGADLAVLVVPFLDGSSNRVEAGTDLEAEAIAHLQCHKTAGVDSIPPEIWKLGGPMLHVKLYNLLLRHWKQGNVTNVDVVEQADIPSIEAMLLKYKL